MPIGYADTEGSIKCRLKTKYADWAKNADWNKICRLERKMPIGQTIPDAAVLDVRVLDYHRRTHARSQCVCVCMCMYVCTCVISNDVRACVFACICMRACMCACACTSFPYRSSRRTSEVQKIIVAALPRAHPMERMAKSSAWPMDRAWPKEKAPQR